MMEFYYHTNFSEDLKDKKARIIRRLKQKHFQRGIYLIALARGTQNHLEFFSALMLKQKILQAEDLFIVGVASGYAEALKLVEQIVDEVYQNTGSTDIRSYILQEQIAYKEGKRQV